MKKLFIPIFAFFPLLVIGQTTPSQDENYILQKVYQVPLLQPDAETLPNTSASNDKKIESIVYYDGLGRPKQSVALRAGGNREDLITPVYYDDLGRQPKSYLPYPELGNEGSYSENILTPLLAYYYNGFPDARHPYDINPYSENRFENSPLNRVLETGAPGKDWEIDPISDTDHTTKFDYQTNTNNEVRDFSVSFSGGNSENPDITYNGYFVANQIYKTATKDENWVSGDNNTIQEFKNKLGQVVLKRAFNAGEKHDTYYIYDDFGNLTYVLPPKGLDDILIYSNGSTSLVSNYPTILSNLCYQYKYDSRNRLIEKKIPGKGWEYILYNKLDLPVMTQDANQRLTDEWSFTKYDAFGRVAYAGVCKSHYGRPGIQTVLINQGAQFETQTTTPTQIGITDTTNLYYTYNGNVSETGEVTIHSINYYDSYVDHTGVAKPTSVLGTYTTESPQVTITTQGLPTVSKVRVLDTDYWITSLSAYDEKRRPIYVDSNNEYLDTRDFLKSKLDFTGKLTESVTYHIKTGSATIITKDYFHYDHLGRILSHKQKIDNEPIQLITENTYDELGRLVQKNVGGQTALDGYTDIEYMDVSFDGSIYHDPPSDPWNWPSKLKTKGVVEEDGGVSYIILQNDKHVRAGLVKNSNGNSANEYLDYGIYHDPGSGNTTLKVMEGGNWVNTTVTYQAGDRFKIQRTGTLIRYYKNDVPFKTVDYVGEIQWLIGKVSFSGPGAFGIETFSLFGQHINKKLQHVDYKYNIRGWLTDINDVGTIPGFGLDDDLFRFRINYNLPIEGQSANEGVVPLYDGNISQTIWKTLNTENIRRSYGYKYDDLNRLVGADSRKNAGLNSDDKYGVSGITYDKNGNILHLNRNGYLEGNTTESGVKWDDLSYTYTGNQLSQIDDATTNSAKGEGFDDGNQLTKDYFYDDNGNLIEDKNKNITSISYNHLNLPTQITFNNGSINYVYDATGTKLKKTISGITTNITIYAGNYIYENIANQGDILQFLNHPEGYIIPTPVVPLTGGDSKSVKGFDSDTGQITYSTYSYVFQHKDHLGNVRLSYADSDLNGVISDGEVIQESNFYPFGLEQKGYNNVISSNGNGLAQNFKYNGKEHNEELGLNTYDFGARNYDPSIGRWMNIDNHADSYYDYSPYNYAANNPLNVIDPDGNDIYLLIWFSKTEESGHAGIAIDNYKTQNKKDANGDDVLDAKGNVVTEQVADGTYTYYDLWPNDPVDPDTKLQTDVTADYSNGIQISSLSDLMGTDPTTHRTGNVAAEGRSADGIVQIPTSHTDDEAAKKAANIEISNMEKYNACYNNCSTFSQRIANIATGGSNQIDAKQRTTLNWMERKYTGYKNADIIAPNNLYNAALKIKNSKKVKGPHSVLAKPYLDYFPKH